MASKMAKGMKTFFLLYLPMREFLFSYGPIIHGILMG